MEIIKFNNLVIALIIRKNYYTNGIKFFTPNHFSQQLAQMTHPAGKIINAHYHKPMKQKKINMQEVLIIKKGKLKVFLYTKKKKFICNKIMKSGDLIFLAHGGHGFKVIEKVTMIEVKQGPYDAKNDKVIFKPKNLK